MCKLARGTTFFLTGFENIKGIERRFTLDVDQMRKEHNQVQFAGTIGQKLIWDIESGSASIPDLVSFQVQEKDGLDSPFGYYWASAESYIGASRELILFTRVITPSKKKFLLHDPHDMTLITIVQPQESVHL